MKSRNARRLALCGLIIFAAFGVLQAGFAVNIVHTHTGNGWLNQEFEITSPQTVVMEGRAPNSGTLRVILDRLGMIRVAEFEIQNGQCRTDNLGELSSHHYDFASRVTNYSSGTGKSCLRSPIIYSQCSCGGGQGN